VFSVSFEHEPPVHGIAGSMLTMVTLNWVESRPDHLATVRLLIGLSWN
jgi:hypothetical protein